MRIQKCLIFSIILNTGKKKKKKKIELEVSHISLKVSLKFKTQ